VVVAMAIGVAGGTGASFSGPDAARFREFCGGGCVGEGDWGCCASSVWVCLSEMARSRVDQSGRIVRSSLNTRFLSIRCCVDGKA
jgi:hypothetical protein